MRSRFSVLRSVLAAALAATLFTAACGGGSDTDTPDAAAAVDAGAQEGDPAQLPRIGSGGGRGGGPAGAPGAGDAAGSGQQPDAPGVPGQQEAPGGPGGSAAQPGSDAVPIPGPTAMGNHVFIEQFRLQLPKFAAGRSDQEIEQALIATCADLRARDETIIEKGAKRFENNGVQPTPTEMAHIALLAVSTACPMEDPGATG